MASRRCSGGFAGTFAAVLYLGGFFGGFHANESFGHWWRLWMWPGYIAYIEVGKYFDANVVK